MVYSIKQVVRNTFFRTHQGALVQSGCSRMSPIVRQVTKFAMLFNLNYVRFNILIRCGMADLPNLFVLNSGSKYVHFVLVEIPFGKRQLQLGFLENVFTNFLHREILRSSKDSSSISSKASSYDLYLCPRIILRAVFSPHSKS